MSKEEFEDGRTVFKITKRRSASSGIAQRDSDINLNTSIQQMNKEFQKINHENNENVNDNNR